MTRNRINIDVDAEQDAWLELTARVVGATKTEVTRALVTYNAVYEPPVIDTLKDVVRNQRAAANQRRGQSRNDRRQVPPESA